MKRLFIIVLVTVGFLALTVSPALAQYGLGYGTMTGLGTEDLRAGIMGIINILLGFLGVIAIVGIIIGGFMMMTAGGNPEKEGNGRKAVMAGLIGLIVIFLAYAISYFVITQLVTATGAA